MHHQATCGSSFSRRSPASFSSREAGGFDVFEPVLRSKGNPSRAALDFYDDPSFRAQFEELFRNEPAGRFTHVRLPHLARQLHSLEGRVRALEEAGTDEMA